MTGWEDSAAEFLQPWKENNNVLAALMTGSYATGLQTEHSDINIHIILDSKTTWRERGYKTVGKHHIAYFATPFKQLIRHFEQDKQLGRHVDATAFANSRILFDKTGVAKQLKDHAESVLDKPFPEPSETHRELLKAGIHNQHMKLKSAKERDMNGFSYTYHHFLDKLLTHYARFLKADLPQRDKIVAFFSDEDFQSRYGVKPFPDPVFSNLFKEAIYQTEPEKQLASAQRLQDHVIDQMGGFDHNNWRIRETL
ncbi:MAG: nucleotidyltransferase domain-containing protein [Candidatus Woesearchaeota archaeon]